MNAQLERIKEVRIINTMLEKIKKIVAAILSFFAVVLPIAEPGIAMDIDLQYEPTQTVCVKWTNKTFDTVSVPRFFVEKQTDGQWETVEFCENFCFPDIYDVYLPLQGSSFTVHCEEVFGKELEPGIYRFSIQYHAKTATGMQSRTAAKEFEIIQSP